MNFYKMTHIRCLQGTHFIHTHTHTHTHTYSEIRRLKGWQTLYHVNIHLKKVGVYITLPDKIDFRAKTTIRGKEGYNMITKLSFH